MIDARIAQAVAILGELDIDLEPRVQVPGHGVATVEEIVVVTASGCRFLSQPQTEIWSVRG
jgi:Xaa-Pro aminopeptidase